jgi:hypothetical protein
MRSTLAILLCLLLTGAEAAADTRLTEPTAQHHFEHGIRLYKEDHFAESLEELRAAYAIEPDSHVLFALAQSARRSGDCRAAADYTKKFLETNPPAKVAEVAKLNILRCMSDMPAEQPRSAGIRASTPAAGRADAAVVVAQPVAAHETPRRPVYKRWWFWTTLSVLVTTGVGVGLGLGLTSQSAPASQFAIYKF